MLFKAIENKGGSKASGHVYMKIHDGIVYCSQKVGDGGTKTVQYK